MRGHRPLVATARALALFVPFSVACVVLLASCDNLTWTGIDSWKHYEGGGTFDTRAPSLSPDGQYLAYASACTGHGDIYLIKSGTNDPVRLTDSQDFESSPMFTPDGKRIVFLREQEQWRHIWMMDSDGSHVTQLTQGNTVDGQVFLSNDGRWLSFGREELSMGMMQLTGHTYVMRLDEPAGKLMRVGEVAMFSGDSRFLVYSEEGKLWRLELDGQRGTRRQIRGTGWSRVVDVSGDGRLMLTRKLPPAGAPLDSIDLDLWVWDTEANSETLVANCHSAVFFGPESKHVLFFVGFDWIPYITTLDGTKTRPIHCAPSHKLGLGPRVCFGGRGAVVGASMRMARPEYDVIFIDFETLEATTIASISSGGCTFQTPSTIEADP